MFYTVLYSLTRDDHLKVTSLANTESGYWKE